MYLGLRPSINADKPSKASLDAKIVSNSANSSAKPLSKSSPVAIASLSS